jgi:hypothetical protein
MTSNKTREASAMPRYKNKDVVYLDGRERYKMGFRNEKFGGIVASKFD